MTTPIVLDCQQGSPEWLRARLGLPTASNFDKVCTPTGKLSASSDRLLAKLAAEWFLGVSLDDADSGFMQRGRDLEPEAAAWYEFDTNQTTTPVGLILRHDRKVGASPDRLVGDDGLLEIKCPSAEVHMTYLLGGMTNDYRCQVQGQLWITGRQWSDLCSYHPSMPKVKVRFERDEDFIALLAEAMDKFIVRLDAAKVKLAGEKSAHDEALAEVAASGDHAF